jgi:hypothetical protein
MSAEALSDIFGDRIISSDIWPPLRYIFGPVEVNAIWRKRYNHELYKLFNEPDIIGFIKVKRLEWARHM